MEIQSATAILESIVEELASIEHERWAHWQRYLHGKSERQADGSLIIPAELASKWESQIERPYASLSEIEKESDRDQVRKYLPTIAKAFDGSFNK